MDVEKWSELKRKSRKEVLRALCITDWKGRTILHRTVGDSRLIGEMLMKIAIRDRAELLRLQDMNGDTALMEAVKHPDSLAHILEKTPSNKLPGILSIRGTEGNTALVLAVQRNNGTMQMILEKLNSKQALDLLQIANNDGYHAVYFVKRSSLSFMLDVFNESEVSQLLKKTQPNGRTIIHQAATDRTSNRLKTILGVIPASERAEILGMKDQNGDTVIHSSILCGGKHLKMVLEAVNPEDIMQLLKTPNDLGITAITLAALSDIETSMEAILDTLDPKSRLSILRHENMIFPGLSALHCSAAAGRAKVVKIILNALNATDRKSLLFTACSGEGIALHYSTDYPEVFKCILELSDITDRLDMLQHLYKDCFSPITKLLDSSAYPYNAIHMTEILELLQPEDRFSLLTKLTAEGCTCTCRTPISRILSTVPRQRRPCLFYLKAIFGKLQPAQRFDLWKTLEDPRDGEGKHGHSACYAHDVVLYSILHLDDSIAAVKGIYHQISQFFRFKSSTKI